MNCGNVLILPKAAEDLEKGRTFYDAQGPNIGDYFWDCLIADIESLLFYAGIHERHHGFYKMLAKRFPYAIYYDIVDDAARVAAILPMRRDPAWIVQQLDNR